MSERLLDILNEGATAAGKASGFVKRASTLLTTVPLALPLVVVKAPRVDLS